MFDVLVTCPPMLRMMDSFGRLFSERGLRPHCPDVVQTLSEGELLDLVPKFDGWIIGDDPANARVLKAGMAGRLKAAVKWGVGVDNVDFAAAKTLGLPISNTPQMFGREVADVAMGYVIALARETFLIDRGVRAGGWPKPRGMSLRDKVMGLVGFGDIGRNVARRALAAEMRVVAFDPAYQAQADLAGVRRGEWPKDVPECDFLVFTCALTPKNRHMLNADVLAAAKRGVRVVNVARGPLIDTQALVAALRSEHVYSAALDVLEDEPLPLDSPLRAFERCVFGSHNASNTAEAVAATSLRAVELLHGFLSGARP